MCFALLPTSLPVFAERGIQLSQRKLQAWQDAGLIDAETVRRITVFEASHAKPLGLWAVIGIGALAIGLGLISVVAANWDAIAGSARLAIHFAIMLGVAGWMFWQQRVSNAGEHTIGKQFFSDAGLFILGALALTFFGHLGQVYQTSSPLWQPLLAWLILFTPALLLLGRGWLAALAWMAGVVGTAGTFASWYVEKIGDMPEFYLAMLLTIPPLIIAFAASMRRVIVRRDFWRRLEQIAMILLAVATALFHLAAEVSGSLLSPDATDFGQIALILLMTYGALAALVFFLPLTGGRDPRSQHAVAAIIGAAGISNLLAALNGGHSEIAAAMIFMAFWAAVGAVSLHAGWRLIFQVAVGILAIRLIILSFQLGIDLLGSGVGLILAGIFTLGIAWGAVRFSRRFAPQRETDDEGEAA